MRLAVPLGRAVVVPFAAVPAPHTPARDAVNLDPLGRQRGRVEIDTGDLVDRDFHGTPVASLVADGEGYSGNSIHPSLGQTRRQRPQPQKLRPCFYLATGGALEQHVEAGAPPFFFDLGREPTVSLLRGQLPNADDGGAHQSSA